MRTSNFSDGQPYAVSGVTGTVAAALAANSLVFGMRAATNPAAGPARKPLGIDKVTLAFTTIVAFTTPLTAGRRLGLYKASGANPTGGGAIVPTSRQSADAGADHGLDASPSIATTAALGATGIVRATDPIATLDLLTFGTAGARLEKTFSFVDEPAGLLVLNPGELLVVSNPAAMDAAGTWQLLVDVVYRRID